jgi:hypothetical protein
MEAECRICKKFFGRARPATGRCSSCGSAFCDEHGLTGDRGEGVCLFCADEFGSRLDALAEEAE